MGKKLIIKGADFSQVAVDTEFNALSWFVTTINNISLGVPIGWAAARSASIKSPREETGMVSPVSGDGMLYYGELNSTTFHSPRFTTKHAVSLKTLHDNGYTSINIKPKTAGNIMVLYSDTPTTSSTNPCASGLNYNTGTTQVTIPITENTYIFIQAKSLSEDPSITTTGSIEDWLTISF